MDMNERPARRPFLAAGLALVLLSLLCALALVPLIHLPAQSDPSSGRGRDLSAGFESGANNIKSGALDGLTYIRKIYKIPESDPVAPAPDPANFGHTTDPAVIRAVIDKASVLLEGQDTVWNEEIELYPRAEYTYYYDETILAIAWKEKIKGKSCTFAEVRIADGSQLRRCLSGDGYDSRVREYGSRLAANANAVVATNGDFYAFRPYGITVYQRQVYRFEPKLLDTCFFTADGDMLLVPADTFTTREEVEDYVRENDVTFSLAFGPITIRDGELLKIDRYRIGEINDIYSRSTIGMVDKLHYLMMTINIDRGAALPAKLADASQIMYDKGCIKAYTLDGGQTAELWMDGHILNSIDWSSERQVSDILYFATALPSEGRREG